MQHPEEGTIHAWLDGALEAAESGQLERHLESCPECSAAVAEARGLIAASSRIVSHLDSVPANVIPATAPKKKSIWLRSAWPSAIAATLIIGIGVVSSREKQKPVTGLDRVAPEMLNPDSLILAQPERTAQAANSEVAPQRTIGPDRGGPTVARGDQTVPPVAEPARTKIAEVPPAAAPQPAPLAQKSAAATAPAVTEVTVASGSIGTADSTARRRAASAAGGNVRVYRRDVPGVAAAAGATMAPEMPRPAAFSDAAPALSGCYQMDASTDVLPARFALVADSAPAMPGHNAVRYVDADGRTSEPISDAGWTAEGGRAIVRTIARGTILTISRAGAQVTAQSPNGSRSGSVAICR